MKRVLTTLVSKDVWYKSFPYTAHIHTHIKHFLYSTVFIQLSSMLSGYPASSCNKEYGLKVIPTACCHSSKSALDKALFFSASLLAQLSTSSSVACFTSFKDQEVATSTCSLSSAVMPENSVNRLLQNKQNLLPASPFRDQTCLWAHLPWAQTW